MQEEKEREQLLGRLARCIHMLAQEKADAGGIPADIQIGTKDMFYFFMRHNYACFSGIFGLFISFSAVFVLILRYGQLDTVGKLVLLLAALLFTVIQPLQLLLKAANQIHGSSMFQMPIHYVFREDGLSLSQNGQTGILSWDQVMKVVETKAYLIIYVTRMRAYIFPKAQFADAEQISIFIRDHCRRSGDGGHAYDGVV